MNKLIKLIIILITSFSVYFIYNNTKNSTYNILNLGDIYSLGINSYNIKQYSVTDYYKEELLKTIKNVNINNNYSKKDQSINKILDNIKNTNTIKKNLSTTNIIIINLGYNDLIYNLAINQNDINKTIYRINKDYNELIDEIRKYTNNKIVVIGYPYINSDYHINKGIVELNKILKNNDEIIFIDTYNLLDNYNKYFSNPNSFLPNNAGYLQITNEIIRKTLDK